MDCKYSFREKTDNLGRNYIVCKLSQQRCTFVRMCPTVENIIHTDLYTRCPLSIKEDSEIGRSIETPDKVVIEKNNKLWVKHHELDQVFIVDNPYDYVPTFVKLELNENGNYYIVK